MKTVLFRTCTFLRLMWFIFNCVIITVILPQIYVLIILQIFKKKLLQVFWFIIWMNGWRKETKNKDSENSLNNFAVVIRWRFQKVWDYMGVFCFTSLIQPRSICLFICIKNAISRIHLSTALHSGCMMSYKHDNKPNLNTRNETDGDW